MFRMECACAEKQRGRMLTRFLHDQAGRYPVEGVGDGLATASRHAAFSTFAYARFSDRTAGKLVPILYAVYRIPIEEYHYRLCPSSSQWKGEKKNCFNSIDKWKIKFRISINFSSRLWRGVRLSVEWERVWENVIATLVRLRIDPITVVHAFLRIRFSRSIPPLFLSCIIRDTRTRNKDRLKRNRQHVKMSDASNGCVGMQKTSPRASSIVGIYARLLHFPLSRALSFSFSRGK